MLLGSRVESVRLFLPLAVAIAVVATVPGLAQLRSPPQVITTTENAVDGRLLNPNVPRGPVTGPVGAFACSRQTLIADVPCVFVGKRSPVGLSLPHPNKQRRVVEALFLDACLTAVPARPKDCQRKAADAGFACAHAPALQDARGDFPPEASACYREMTEALDDVRSAAAFQSSCCRCASACAPAPAQCSDASRLPSLQGECVNMCAQVCGFGRVQ